MLIFEFPSGMGNDKKWSS